jgi:hypothetical protein
MATETAVGQGVHPISAAATYTFSGEWETMTISGAERGKGCAWYAFWCDEAEFNAPYAVSDDPEARLDFTYNGQPVEVTYSIGPDRGIWAVEIDGRAIQDENGEPFFIDAYHPTVRYDVTREFQAESEGEHTLSLINTGQKADASQGARISVSQVEVLPPLRSSNLGAILGLLLGLQVIGVAFAYLVGPRAFNRISDWLDTKNSIMLALIAYSIISIWGYFLNSVVEFWFLAWMVATVQGGSQALSRSLYASMTPDVMSGEFFGFFSIMSKFASFLSPLVFVLSVAFFDSSRPGVLSLIGFFAVGMFLLNRVDVAAGRALAKKKDAELVAATSE